MKRHIIKEHITISPHDLFYIYVVCSDWHYSRGTYSWWGPHQQSTRYWNINQCKTKFKLGWGLHFNHDAATSAMVHVLILIAKVRRNEWRWHTLDIGNVFDPTFGFKSSKFSSSRSKITKKLRSSWYIYIGKFCTTLFFSRFGEECLKWLLMDSSSRTW